MANFVKLFLYLTFVLKNSVKFGKNEEKEKETKEMQKNEKNQGQRRVLDLLSPPLCAEINSVLSRRSEDAFSIREISLRRFGVSKIITARGSAILSHRVGREEMEGLFRRITDGALYAHRDTIAKGYVSIGGGVRVGVCGCARYDGDRLVGVSDISSLLFRIPGGECAFGREIFSLVSSGIRSGALIYSTPGVGKTTALRHLAREFGRAGTLRVAVVDERLEFCEEDYFDCDIDILRGYKRSVGIEIATRTLSAGMIIIDEIGADDVESICDVIRCGIPIIATAHAESFEEIKAKRSLSPLIKTGAFNLFVGIMREGDGYRLTADRI